MTRARVWGEDSPFGDWLRRHRDLDSESVFLSATDRDFTIHRYKDNVDGLGGRRVQLMMAVEVKTNWRPEKNVSKAQRQTKFFEHQLLNRKRKLMCASDHVKKDVWHFGYHYLLLSGERPDEASTVGWTRFTDQGGLLLRHVSTTDLVRVLRFDLRPDTLKRLKLRRHHSEEHVEVEEETPLGFTLKRVVTFRS